VGSLANQNPHSFGACVMVFTEVTLNSSLDIELQRPLVAGNYRAIIPQHWHWEAGMCVYVYL
jgi:hypothetical protein